MWRNYLSKNTSIAPLAFFRVVFGLLMCFAMVRFAYNGWIAELYILPKHFFPFYGFEWLPRPSSFGVKLLFFICGFSALNLALGLFYRINTVAFLLSFVYIELLDKTNYLNHYYFISVVALVLVFLPAAQAYSLDSLRRKKSAVTTPAWTVDILKILLGFVYFFAGLAKINPDWLLDAVPMRIWLQPFSDLPLVGDLLGKTATAFVFSWAGMLYDVSVFFLLLWSRTRLLAYIAVVSFHLLTAYIFPIGMFPYIMIGLTLVFFPPQLHLRIFSFLAGKILPTHKAIGASANQNAIRSTVARVPKRNLYILSALIGVQLLLPFRYAFYPDKLFWTEQGYRFSWRVMLIEKAGKAFFYVSDPAQKGEIEIDNTKYLTPQQEKMMATQPDMLLQYAHLIAADYQQLGIVDPAVRAEVWVTLNGSGSRLFIDPACDLTKENDTFAHKNWILPSDSIITATAWKKMQKQRQQP